MGFNNTGYAGAFTPVVKRIINTMVAGRVLHLYSGVSQIGDVRVDLKRPEATHNISVEDWITNDKSEWDWCILDPPYQLDKRQLFKLRQYAKRDSIWGNNLIQASLKKYFVLHVNNVLWLDFSAPVFRPFRRRKIWLFLPGGFRRVRVLSWLERETKLLLC